MPHLLIQVEYTQGLEGTVLLVMRLREAAVLADLMMGGDGHRSAESLSDLEISAAAEVMNQMIGSSSTSMASVFSRAISITPPVARIIDSCPLSLDEQVVSVNFRILVHDLLDSSIIQILSLSTARTQASFLLSRTVPA